jgi:MATE family multidrug resistance protein
MMIVSVAAYFAAWWVLTPQFGNHGLWASPIVFFAVRGLTLGARLPALVRRVFAG